MLRAINIKNIVLIEELELDFAAGFTALTGETGAGKSIILTALGLVLGKKAEGSIIRFGQDSGEVTAEFDVPEQVKKLLDENGIDSDGLIIRRRIGADGKSKSYVNDTPVSLKLLAEIGESLVEIHGQHDQSTLLEPAVQREIIDGYARLGKEISALGEKFREWKSGEKELEERRAKIAKAKHEEDYLRHMLGELSELNAQESEETELADRRRAMMDYEKLAGVIRSALEELTSDRSAEGAILGAQKTLTRTNNEIFTAAIEALERASVELGNAISEIERVQGAAEYDPVQLENIEERLFAIREIARKYDTRPEQLNELKEQTAQKLSLLGKEEGDLRELEQKVAAAEKEYREAAGELSKKRVAAARKLEKTLLAELKPLAMQGTKFEVSFAEAPPAAHGVDKVEFLASTNPGTPLAKLADIASGGEISRFMLALKVVLLGASAAPTIIFDEIDTGTGGSVAAAIGERLARLGRELQVFVVTHLPQVASQAASHLKVTKKTVKGRNITSVETLSANERKEELARMLAGAEITSEARAAAGRLLG